MTPHAPPLLRVRIPFGVRRRFVDLLKPRLPAGRASAASLAEASTIRPRSQRNEDACTQEE